VVLAACGDRDAAVRPSAPPAETVRVDAAPWAQLTRSQVDEAGRMGVPAAFENARGMRFVYVPCGDFPMGSPEREPGRGEDEHQHGVTLHIGYFMQVGAVTRAQRAGTAAAGRPGIAAGVTRAEAIAFAEALSVEDDLWAYRLPTEAEWERACRAGSTTAYAWGDEAAAPPDFVNAWGLRSMHVGVREWCRDRYGPLPSWAVGDPLGPQAGEDFVVRGGGTPERPSRCAARAPAAPTAASPDLGMRLVVPLGYGLGKYGSVAVTFRLTDAQAEPGAARPDADYDLRIIRMNDRLAARTDGREADWARLEQPGSPVTLRMVPGKYYVYAEANRAGTIVRGREIKFHVWERAIDVPVPIPERDLKRYGSGGAEKPQ